MKSKIIVSLFFVANIFVTNIFSGALSWFDDYSAKKSYKKKDYNKVKEILEKKQADKPNDPQINYNLGNAYYNLAQYEKAKLNFQRAVDNCSSEQRDLKEFSSFNLGNSFYKNCLNLLGSEWETKDLDNNIIDNSILEIESAIKNFADTTSINQNNTKAKANKKITEDLLDKLKKKKKKQQEENNKDKKQEQKQDNKQDKNKSQDNKSQDNKNEQNSEKNKQKKQDSRSEPENQNKNKSEQKDQTGSDLDKKQQEKQNSEKQEEKTAQEKEKKQKNGQQEAEQEKERVLATRNGAEQKTQTIKEKGAQVVLDNLQNHESAVQKALIEQKLKMGGVPSSNQKSW